jgi:hypothetical protein
MADPRLTDTEWGREVQQLENLRLLRRIGVAVPNTNTWRQVRVVIMMIDLAAIMNQRLGVKIIEFWKGQAEFDKLRRAVGIRARLDIHVERCVA